MTTPAGPDLSKPSEVRDLLARHGHRLGRSMGQHLLVDRRVLARIVETSGVGPGDTVLEVGPGVGTLTRELADRADRVVAVEADKRLEPLLRETLDRYDNVDLIFEDALRLDPSRLGSPTPTRLIANLPYNVAATLVLGLLQALPDMADATVMVQREVGERMTASPGTKAYGAYTVKLSLRADPKMAFRVSAAAFFPPPRVESAVVTLVRKAPPPTAPPLKLVDTIVDAAFAQRRKMLRSGLSAALDADRSSLETALTSANIDPTGRAENLTTDDFVRLTLECERRALVTLRAYPDQHKI